MKKTFEYNYEIKSANTLDIDDIGNVCIKVLNIFNNYWYLIISTSLGETNIKTFGPINIENKLTKIKEFEFKFQKFDYKESKIITIIDKFINDEKKIITSVCIVDENEVFIDLNKIDFTHLGE